MDVQSRCLTLQARISGEDHLADLMCPDATHKVVYVKVLGANAIERREPPSEDVVEPAKFPRALDGADIGCFLDDTEEGRIATRIAADGAQLTFGEVEALGAGMDALTQRREGVCEPTTLFRGLPEQVIRESKGRLATDTRELRELGRESVDG